MTEIETNQTVRDWLGYGSYVDTHRRILYVSTPKVGCSSIKHMLRRLATSVPLRFNPCAHETSLPMQIHDRDQIPLRPLTAFSGEELQQIMTGTGWFRFCVIRHPYDRFFAAWRDKIFLCQPSFERYLPAGDQKYTEFSAFLDRVMADESPKTCDCHWRNQVDLLLPDDINYTRIYNMSDLSDLQSDLQHHLTAIGIADRVPPLQRLNKSWSFKSDGFLTPDVIKKLWAFYRADFERFGFAEIESKCQVLERAADYVNDYTDAIFERNRVIWEQSRCANDAAGEIRRLNNENRILLARLGATHPLSAVKHRLSCNIDLLVETVRRTMRWYALKLRSAMHPSH